MARTRDQHPLGKCVEERIEIGMPSALKTKLGAIAAINGKTPTAWARDVLEKAIEGEWVFMRRRVAGSATEEQPGENPDA